MKYFNVLIFVLGISSILCFTTNYPTCRPTEICTTLTLCIPYINLIRSLKKPLQPSAVKFLRRQECGFDGSYPMVCCYDSSKLLPRMNKTTTEKPHRKPKENIQEKMHALNTAFALLDMDYFFVRRMLEGMENNNKTINK
ncbi:uncharacterized protein LOC115889348 [Sitophilus oryzae]|uniref:Uncharacterized protein LOC115889348 n=1 Tax=Sitophilus oryzae TaxID=7048 RepID=A0A6J2YPG8_SITOR|nr:uncharacterized protein LOC115889348 [Sitophilus oryzae]